MNWLHLAICIGQLTMDERPAANRANGTNGAAWTLRLASTMSSAGGAMRALLQAREEVVIRPDQPDGMKP